MRNAVDIEVISLKQRVVITGMGVMTSLGKDLETFWDSLMAGKSGISQIEAFDVSEYTTELQLRSRI